MPRLLDLFCGAGGCSAGYDAAGFHVVGVDHRAQPRYPFAFIRGDALAFLDELLASGDWYAFDAIHASPPCQVHSPVTMRNRRYVERERAQAALVPRHVDLIDATRRRLEQTGLPYVIENVPGAPLRAPATFCGSSFELDVRRHRLFETNWPLVAPACDHDRQTPRFAPNDDRRGERLASVVTVGGHITYRGEFDLWQQAMGVDWMTAAELAQAIPPAYTHAIGAQLIDHLDADG